MQRQKQKKFRENPKLSSGRSAVSGDFTRARLTELGWDTWQLPRLVVVVVVVVIVVRY